MLFHKPATRYYCGVDLHSRSMYLCVFDCLMKVILLHKNIGIDPEYFLKLISPWAKNITVVVESTFNWYWLYDYCESEGIHFALAHSLYLKAVNGAKTKNDRIDSEKIARIAAGGTLPLAYTYPREHRSIRDFIRRRNHFVQMRAELLGHIQCLNMQENNPPLGHATKNISMRPTIPGHFMDPGVRLSVEANLEAIQHYDAIISKMEKEIRKIAYDKRQKEMSLLTTVPGIGDITALIIAYEIHDINRFAGRQEFCSYARLIGCEHQSGGKKRRSPGAKIGNPHLKWAFSEAAIHSKLNNDRIRKYADKLETRHKKGVANGILAHKIGRAVYYMLKNGTVFDLDKFLQN